MSYNNKYSCASKLVKLKQSMLTCWGTLFLFSLLFSFVCLAFLTFRSRIYFSFEDVIIAVHKKLQNMIYSCKLQLLTNIVPKLCYLSPFVCAFIRMITTISLYDQQGVQRPNLTRIPLLIGLFRSRSVSPFKQNAVNVFLL